MDINYWLLKGCYSAVVFIIAKMTHWFLNRTISRVDSYAEAKGLSAFDFSDGTKKSISQFSKYIIYLIAFLVILYIFELGDLLMGIATAAGVAGIAIGFAAKDLLSNALSGIILFFDRPFKIGDIIQVGRYIEKGRVESIGIRQTVLKLRDGRLVTVPNASVLSQEVTNFTSNPIQLVELIIEVDVDANVKKALKIIDELLDKLEWKDKTEGAWVSVSDVNKDNVILKIKAWTNNERLGDKKTELFYSIRDSLKKARIKSSVLREEQEF
ncbi:MAG: mechanosensitive ion channel family protein [Candidatus Nanoarchaeia archaeon]|jgi:small conductance mechanosensitive channel